MLLLCLFFVSFLTKKFFNETSTNILGVSLLGGTRWNTPQSVQTCWNPSEPVQICPDPSKNVQTCRNTSEPVETRFNPFRSVQTRFQSVETRSNLLVQTCWNTFPLLHPPFSPLLPLFPFLFFLGGEGVGEGWATTTTAPPPPSGF